MRRELSYKESELAKVLPPEGEPVWDLDELVDTMGRVAIAAARDGLPQFRYGFHGYQRVTRRVTEAARAGEFKDNDKMMRTMPVFAERAFVPLRHHAHGETDEVGAWAPMLYNKSALAAAPSTAMVDFLGFHVVYDLPFTLIDTNTQPHHQDDYAAKINLILSEAANELLPEYVEVHPPFKALKAENIGLWLVLRDLFAARDDAWHAFTDLRTAEQYAADPQRHSGTAPKSAEQIETDLRNKATRRMLSSNKIASFVLKHTTRTPDHWALAA